jgi:hypothetical protein
MTVARRCCLQQPPASLVNLSPDVWRGVADALGTAEWARGAGASCRTLHALQRYTLVVGTCQRNTDLSRSALAYLHRHCQSAQDVSISLMVGSNHILHQHVPTLLQSPQP